MALLRKPLLVHVATVMPDGTPQSTPVWVDTDGEKVLFNTAKGRVKHRNMLRNPAVALSFVDDDNPYRMLRYGGQSISSRMAQTTTSTSWPRSTSTRTSTPSANLARNASSCRYGRKPSRRLDRSLHRSPDPRPAICHECTERAGGADTPHPWQASSVGDGGPVDRGGYLPVSAMARELASVL